MKRVLRIAGIIVGILIVVIGIALTAFVMKFPKGGELVDIKVPTDSARIAHGKYLAYHVAGCVECHGTRNLKYFAGPLIPGTEGKGGEAFTHDFGFPGTIYARNITPGGLTGWTDADLFHAVTTGVNKDGNALFPLMPYQHFGKADESDILDILAFIKTLPSYDKVAPASEIDFPVNFIMRTAPAPANFTTKPKEWDSVAYGAYLVNMGSCSECHTTMDDHHQPLPGMDFAGGNPFILKGMGTVVSANLTPDKETGLGNWTEDMFVSAFKFFDNPDHLKIPWQQKGYQTLMPWGSYAGMKESDLKCIYQYLRTVKPVSNRVVKFTASTDNSGSQQ
jgi:mono/diheme cytochrome c family protein